MMRNVARILAPLWLACQPLTAGAEIKATLQLMLDAALTRADVKAARIDAAAQSLVVTMADGTERVMFPQNIDLVLAGLPDDQSRRAELDHFMEQLSQVAAPDGPRLTEAALISVLPVVSMPGMYADVAAGDPSKAPIEQGFAPGLSQYLVIDTPGSVSYLNTADLSASGRNVEDLAKVALANLRRKSGAAMIETVLDKPWIATVTLDGFYEGSLMLLPEFWNDLTAQYGPIGLAYPGRGAVFLFSANDPEGAAFMAGFLREEMANIPYPVSAQLLDWTGTGWALHLQ